MDRSQQHFNTLFHLSIGHAIDLPSSHHTDTVTRADWMANGAGFKLNIVTGLCARARADCHQGASPCGHAEAGHSQASDLPCKPVHSRKAGRLHVCRWEVVVFVILWEKAAQKVPV